MNNPEQYNAFTYAGDAQAVQVVEQGDSRKLIGYAVVWGATSDVRADGFRHRFNKGSIVWTPTVHALFAHQYFLPLGSTANESLKLGEDDTGVRVEITLDDTTDGANALKRVRAGLIAGMSFGGRRISFAQAEGNVIDVTRFLANEVSIVANPAMADTLITTIENSDALAKVRDRQAAKNLSRTKLALLRPRT